MMYDKKVLEIFLENQSQLFEQNVANTLEEASEFLEDTLAYVAKDYKELKAYFEENADISGMSKEEILSSAEVFSIPDGRFLIVEG